MFVPIAAVLEVNVHTSRRYVWTHPHIPDVGFP